MSNLLDRLEQGRRFLNTQFERAVSKTVARALLGHEIDGYDYVAPVSRPERDSERDYFSVISSLWRRPTKKKEEIIETSITLDYRRVAWGLERIVLDGITNHLPADSKGTKVSVKLKQNGEYVELKNADQDAETTEVVFEDDGSGYDYHLLSLLFSTKGADTLSVGQFGEGLKLVAAAALRKDILMEYRSRNWRARPVIKRGIIEKMEIERLCFSVCERDGSITGSQTVFLNPNEEFLDELFQLPRKVLCLNDTYKECSVEKLYVGYQPRIIDLGDGSTSLYVKGVRFNWPIEQLWSYDLGIEQISPDRQTVDQTLVLDNIRSLLERCKNPAVIRRILEKAHSSPDEYYTEFEALRSRSTPFEGLIVHKKSKSKLELTTIKKYLDIYSQNSSHLVSQWPAVFSEMYGKDAVIASSNDVENTDAELMGYHPIRLNKNIGDYLASLGVKKANVIKVEQEYRWVEPADLTAEEKEMLGRVDELSKIVLGGAASIPIEVRVYSGLYTTTGREITSSLGVQQTRPDGTKYIGIKRELLGDLEKFANTYIHELGHCVTGAGDYDRTFVDFFTHALARIAARHLSETPPKPL